MESYLGIDIGTSAVKILLVDRDGTVVGEQSIGYEMNTPKPGWAEQDPNLWWHATIKAIRKLASSNDLSQTRGIGLSGQMHGAVLLDESYKPVYPAMLWCDQRTEAQCDEIEKRLPHVGVLTGNRTLTGFTAPKLLWLRDHHPEIFERIRHIMLPKDFVRLQLTGELGSDVSDASGTLLLDVSKRQWSSEVCSALGIPIDLLPPLFESADQAGSLRRDIAIQLGLPTGIPVAAGGGDQASGAVGVGVVRGGIGSVALGTSGVVFCHDEHYLPDDQYRLHAFCHGVPGKWHRMGVMLSAAGSLQWWRNQLDNSITYDTLTAEAEKAPIGCEGLLFLPYLTGERTPHPDSKARGAFIGLNVRHQRAHMTRSVLEGITYGLRDSYTIMQQSNVSLSQLRLSGGGAKSPFWRQLIADIFGIPTVTVNSTDGPALGAAIFAASAAGQGDIPSICNRWIAIQSEHEPNGSTRAEYDEIYEIYSSLYGILKPAFHKLDSLAKRNFTS